MLVRADWVVSWGLGVAAWRLGCMTSFSCLLLLGRDVPSRWHFTGILEHITKQFTIFLSSASGASFGPVHDRLLAAAEKSDGDIGGKGGDGVAVQGRESEGQRRLDVATRSVSAPDRLYGGGEGAEDSVPEKHCMALRIAELGRRCIGIPSSRAGLGVAWPCLSQLPSSH